MKRSTHLLGKKFGIQILWCLWMVLFSDNVSYAQELTFSIKNVLFIGNENIDVINYTKNEQLFISRALSPAKVTSMEIEMYEEERNGKKGRVSVLLKPEEVSKAIGRGGVNIRLASELTGYEIDVKREGLEEEDVELTEFSDEIEAWVIKEFKNIGLDTARSVLEASVEELVKRTDLEEETILDVQRILKEEFEE